MNAACECGGDYRIYQLFSMCGLGFLILLLKTSSWNSNNPPSNSVGKIAKKRKT